MFYPDRTDSSLDFKTQYAARTEQLRQKKSNPWAQS